MTAEILKRMVAQLVSRHPYHDNVGTLLQAQGGPIYMPPPARPRLPAALQQALARRTPVRILYVSRGRKTRRVISPLYATEHNGNIYLVAYCHLRQAQRTFRLDRIAGAEPAE
jgi:predicted DNA-binding transcriptional regulator YafY